MQKRKEKSPKISIITPSYNQAKYIEQTIRSVVEQDYSNIEYLIMDGGSTDGSVEIIKKYAKKYPNIIKWQSKKDGGQVKALNEGLKKVSGDIVAYINSDDYYLPGAFKKVESRLQKGDWLVGDCIVSDSDLAWTFWIKLLWPIDRHKSFLRIFNTINQPSVFLTKELIDKVGYFDNDFNYAFDYDYWLRCLSISLPTRLMETLSVFRIHSDSKGNTNFENQFNEDLLVIKKNTKEKLIIALHQFLDKIVIVLYRFLK
jgi:glycosyltransferase involved in cell wall biosynthesis